MVLKLILCCYMAICGGYFKMENVKDCFNSATQIKYICDGKTCTYQKGDDKYEIILSSLEKIMDGGYQMPAFAVSIDKLTREELKSGNWIEFEFDSKTLECNNMPFEALLIKVQSEYHGFNIIRKFNGKYEGRCFYFNLNGDMSQLFDTLKSLPTKN